MSNNPLVIIPTYNERENLAPLVRRLLELGLGLHILVVDDGSPDGTGELADDLAVESTAVHVLHGKEKSGLGRAYIAGFKWALARDYEFIFEMDGDFSHDPADIPVLLKAVQNADLVLGSRYKSGIRVINWLARRLMLSLGAARENARRSRCADNLRKIGGAAQRYADTHRGDLPEMASGLFWPWDVNAAVTDALVATGAVEMENFYCPSGAFGDRYALWEHGWVENEEGQRERSRVISYVLLFEGAARVLPKFTNATIETNASTAGTASQRELAVDAVISAGGGTRGVHPADGWDFRGGGAFGSGVSSVRNWVVEEENRSEHWFIFSGGIGIICDESGAVRWGNGIWPPPEPQ